MRHYISTFIKSTLLVCPLLTTPVSAQGFYGSSEYMDQQPPPPPPPSDQFTQLQPPPPPPPSPGNAWQRDGYRRGNIPMPWSGPILGRYGNPTFSPLHDWGNPNFTSWNTLINNQDNRNNTPLPPSKACIDGNCIGN